MEFTTIFNQLSDNQKCLITNTMIHMEHSTPIRNIDIAHGIRYGRLLKGLSESDMIAQASEIYAKAHNIFNGVFSVEDIYHSMIHRNSRNSKLYPIIINLLEINEDIIATCYFSNLDTEELFSTLSLRNQSAVIYLMQNLDTDFSLETISGNIGVQEDYF